MNPPGAPDEIWVLPLEGDKKPVPFLIDQLNVDFARFSPDGRWVAYTSDALRNPVVYVKPFSLNSAGTAVGAGRMWQISDGWGIDPHWSGDGRELYYCLGNGRLMAVEIAAGPAFRNGKPQPVAQLSDPQEPFTANLWDVSEDGKVFFAAAKVKSGPQPYTVVLNWQAGLKK